MYLNFWKLWYKSCLLKEYLQFMLMGLINFNNSDYFSVSIPSSFLLKGKWEITRIFIFALFTTESFYGKFLINTHILLDWPQQKQQEKIIIDFFTLMNMYIAFLGEIKEIADGINVRSIIKKWNRSKNSWALTYTSFYCCTAMNISIMKEMFKNIKRKC